MKLYPVDASNADDWLAEEIFRAACDPGALAVFRCNLQLTPLATVCLSPAQAAWTSRAQGPIIKH